MNIYVVYDDIGCYKYAVKADSYKEAIELVRQHTGHPKWNWNADLCDNSELIEKGC